MSTLPERTVFVSGRIPPGTTLNGIYEIESSLAPGGMGEVYKGHETFSLKKVAIKFIRRELEENADARQMFINEGNSLAELHHDAIVRCFPLSIDPVLRRLYLPMEFVEGPSLFDLMEAGALNTDDVRLLLKRVAAGLQAAHERQIFHRDVSPDNIIVPNRDLARAKIIDFGIARSINSGRATVIGSGFAGKHNYVSPEQCGLFGGDVQAQSDIYSLGLVVAGLLLGRPLDMGGSMVEVMTKRQAMPDLTGLDEGLRPVIAAMLRPNPADRPASMSAVVELLEAPAPAPAPPTIRSRTRPPTLAPFAAPTRAGRRPLLLGLGTMVAVAAVGAAAWFALRPGLRGDLTPDPERQFVAGYQPERCLLLQPETLAPTTADFTAFTDDSHLTDDFGPAYQAKFGLKPDLTTIAVTTPQCPALALARTAGAGTAGAPRLMLDQPAVPKKSGRKIAGAIDVPTGSTVAFYRIDENGTVQDLSDGLRKAERSDHAALRDLWSFQPVLDRAGDADTGAAPQVFVAVASATPLSIPPIVVAEPSSTFLPRLQAVLTGRLTAGVALAAFALDK